MLDVRRLQVLRAVARDGSLSAAARTLGYTQPAISHHIAKLEAEIGTALLTRLGRGVQLTDAGVALVEHSITARAVTLFRRHPMPRTPSRPYSPIVSRPV